MAFVSELRVGASFCPSSSLMYASCFALLVADGSPPVATVSAMPNVSEMAACARSIAS